MKKELGIAIKRLREKQGIRQDEIAEALGIDKGNVSRYESGASSPDIGKLPLLARVLNTDVHELFALAEGLEIGPDVRGTVPLISWVQAGDWSDAIDNLTPGEGERITTTYKPRKHTYGLRIKGDSMEPKFPMGCIVIVEPDEAPHNGSYVIVRQNGDEATFKQYIEDGSTKYLKPLNDRYPIMELRKDAVFCGVVKQMTMEV